MKTDTLVTVFGIAITAVIALAAFLSASRANRATASAAATAVDAGAYDRAREIYESALGTLRGELDGCRREVAETRVQIVALRTDNEQLLAELRSVSAELKNLKGRA